MNDRDAVQIWESWLVGDADDSWLGYLSDAQFMRFYGSINRLYSQILRKQNVMKLEHYRRMYVMDREPI